MSRARHLKAAVILAILVALVYGRTLTHDFVSYDDSGYIKENPRVLAGLSWEGVKYAISFTEVSYWQPLPLLSHMADCSLFGPNPGLHHMVSALFHLVNAFFLYLALGMLTGGYWGRSLLVAALFAVHPLNVESVAWIAERKNLLSTFFWLAALIFYAAYAKRPSIIMYSGVFMAMLLGLLSKPAVITLPVVLLILDCWPLGRYPGGPGRTRRILKLIAEKLPLMALSAGSVLLTVQSTRKSVFGLSVETDSALLIRIQNAIVSSVRYIENAIWPENLAFFYPFPSTVPISRTLACTAILAALAALFWGLRKKRPYLLAGYAWFLVTLSPMSGLIQSGMWPAMADRFAYLPLIGLFMAAVWLGADLAGSRPGARKAARYAGVAVVCAFAAAAFVQAGHWKNSKSLYLHALDATGDNFLAHVNLGAFFLEENDNEKALFHSNRAWLLNPSLDEPAVNTGNAWNRLENPENAIFWYRRALSIKPDRVRTHLNLASTLLGLKRIDEAEKELIEALRLAPSNPEANSGMGLVKKARGDAFSADQNIRLPARPGGGTEKTPQAR